MAYRKTEKVLAALAARRDLIIASAIDIMAKSGAEALTADAISERSEMSVGAIYLNFPDMVELRAAIVQEVLTRDLAVIREAGTLGKGIRAFAQRLSGNYRVMSWVGAQPVYRTGIRAELAKLIKSAGGESPAMFAAVAYGAVFEAASTLRPRDEVALTACLLKAFGVRARETA